ncbi:MAG: hypothetical protein IJU84_07545 [Clostridia bacterium]|nr:hypothetical protein [Clostridia bacterium]
MKNELFIPNGKRKRFLLFAVISATLAVLGLALAGASFDARYTENFTEITATARRLEKDENEYYIYTEEIARPLRLTSVYTAAMPAFETLSDRIAEGVTVIVHAADADLYNENKAMINISSLKAGEATFLTLQDGIKLQKRNLMTARIVGIAFAAVFSAVTALFFVLFARAKKEKTMDIFTFLGTFAVGPQARERRRFNLAALIYGIMILAAGIPAAIFVSVGNNLLAQIFAVVLVCFALIGAGVLIISSVFLKKAEINYYDDLFSFTPEVLPPASSDVFPFFGSDKLCRFSESGVNLIDDSILFRFDPEVGITDGTPVAEVYEGEKAFAEYKETPCIPQDQGVYISYKELNLRAVAVYGNRSTRITIIIASDFDPQKYGMENDMCFMLDGYMYITLKKYGVPVRGLEKALAERRKKMLAARRSPYGPFFYE